MTEQQFFQTSGGLAKQVAVRMLVFLYSCFYVWCALHHLFGCSQFSTGGLKWNWMTQQQVVAALRGVPRHPLAHRRDDAPRLGRRGAMGLLVRGALFVLWFCFGKGA